MSEPLFWYRPVCNGEMYEGPIHNNSVGGKMMRDEKPGEWLPLYAEAQAQAELNAARALLLELVAAIEDEQGAMGICEKAHLYLDARDKPGAPDAS